MIKTITRSQMTRLENDIKQKIDEVKNKNYVLTFADQMILLFLDVQKGAEKNGLEVEQIADLIGINKKDFKALCTIRTKICQFQSQMIKEAIPWGGLKVGKRKRYGWLYGNEYDRLQLERKKRIAIEIQAGLHYMEDNDLLTNIGKKFILEYDKQLKLFEEK